LFIKVDFLQKLPRFSLQKLPIFSIDPVVNILDGAIFSFSQIILDLRILFKLLGGDSQNFLRKFVRFFVTLGLKILKLLRLFWLKVIFEEDIIKGQC
jgi:hypothetical protein